MFKFAETVDHKSPHNNTRWRQRAPLAALGPWPRGLVGATCVDVGRFLIDSLSEFEHCEFRGAERFKNLWICLVFWGVVNNGIYDALKHMCFTALRGRPLT